MTKAKQSGAFKGHRFPSEIIPYAVWAYFRFPMSFRDVEDLLYKRGVIVSYETVRSWVGEFGHQYAKVIRRDRPAPSDKWHLDEVVIRFKQSFALAATNYPPLPIANLDQMLTAFGTTSRVS